VVRSAHDRRASSIFDAEVSEHRLVDRQCVRSGVHVANLSGPVTPHDSERSVGHRRPPVDHCEVWRRDVEIVLSGKEFALLELFMRNAGCVLTREQILAHLWDFGFDSFSNIVDVHVKNLRKKLDCGRRERLIVTVRGVGYQLRV